MGIAAQINEVVPLMSKAFSDQLYSHEYRAALLRIDIQLRVHAVDDIGYPMEVIRRVSVIRLPVTVHDLLCLGEDRLLIFFVYIYYLLKEYIFIIFSFIIHTYTGHNIMLIAFVIVSKVTSITCFKMVFNNL